MFNWFKRKKNDNQAITEEKNLDNFEEESIEEIVEEFIEEDSIEEELEDMSIVEEAQADEFEEDYEMEEAVDSADNNLEESDYIPENSNEELSSQDEDFKTVVEPEEEEKAVKKLSFFEKLKNGLTKTRKDMSGKIEGILNSYKKVDEELFEDLEDVLVSADVGVNTTMEIIDRLRKRVKEEKVNEPSQVKELLKDEIRNIMKESVSDNNLSLEPTPAVILVVGVNGVGKTTTIGKLSHRFKEEGKKVLIAAGDTFRAAAIEQLEEWSKRSGVEFIAHTEGADPAAVIFDGIQAAKARKSDILICDTAGRLHNKSNLMNELNKIFRVVEREYGNATKEVLLVLDATTGQNAINQAKVFKEVANITGVALTKLDGTAKGGVIIALQAELNLPVKLVGVGEGIEDLQEFVVDDFVEAIFN